MSTEELHQRLIGTGSCKGSEGISNLKLTAAQPALNGLDKVLKLLPKGASFVFTALVLICSNNDQCELVKKIVAAILIAACGFSCALASFIDSYIDKNGKTLYGIVTTKGLWTFDDSDSDTGADKEASQYKLRFADFIHAGLSLLVFAVVTMLNSNTVDCLYPSFEAYENTLMAVLPAVMNAIASLVFMLFRLTGME